MKGVILAGGPVRRSDDEGGLGTRLRPLTRQNNSPL